MPAQYSASRTEPRAITAILKGRAFVATDEERLAQNSHPPRCHGFRRGLVLCAAGLFSVRARQNSPLFDLCKNEKTIALNLALFSGQLAGSFFAVIGLTAEHFAVVAL
jgi:hypothetical protein